MESTDLGWLLPCARFNRALDFRRLDVWTSRRSRRLGDADFAYLAPAARLYENWMPVKKFKHGKWKYYRQPDDKRADEDRQASSEPGWNPYND